MATSTTNTITSPLRDAWQRFAATLERRFETHMRIRSRRDEIEALEAKSDAELVRIGIRRDQIAVHVFRDLFYA
ncbi:hypothetical protein [Roseovarius sp. D22-M7]|uniref:hypothetical protein n=1 Tax=Roseovarius sp. D22-M7 TaxID=3127116 RepID=UPI0030102073